MHHPCQGTNGLFARLTPLRLTVVGAVRRSVQQAYRAAARGLQGTHVPNVRAQMARLRVVDLVHGDGVRIVVDRDVDMAAQRLLDARAGAAAAGEQVNDEGCPEGEDELRCQHVFSRTKVIGTLVAPN